MSCIFCKIANGEIPSNTIYETDLVRAILDINPSSYGHVLVLPKVHCTSLLEADAKTIDAVFEAAGQIAKKMDSTLHCDGINLLSNMKEAAGQTVEHFHVHLIPRFQNQEDKDQFHVNPGHIQAPQFEELVSLLAL